MEIFDVSGVRVFTYSESEKSATKNIETRLKNGVYLCRVVVSDEVVQQKKLIIIQ